MAQGIFISTFAGGSAVGLAVGGPIVNYFGWHATFFSIIPIAVALIVMVDRLIYVSKEEQEPPKSKLDFDYSCVFTKLNQEQLQSQRKDAEQVTIAVISVPPSVTVRAYTPDAKLTPHKEPASLPIMSGKPLYTNYDLSEIKITGLPKATILNPYGGTPYLIAWQTYIGFAMKLSYLASNGYTVLTDAVFSPTIQRIHNNSIILGGSEGITGIMKMNGPITSATSGTIHLEGISDPEPTD